ncbi:hypothetical protein QAD02_017527 [Eretmocerus hayati]|uniref:Uncharacterized protein n=1 Tax=Eretmocerus hayati TaxID=131215 RepID=A0ACC2PIX3_9HYME|nr:hypothetical protein QAD02_017527 [Eretmocerus hayati]
MRVRDVHDSEGVFSGRLASNWAELPQTLRKRELQRHRPDILSQFTDIGSESECSEYPRSVGSFIYQQQQHKSRAPRSGRSEFLRRLDNRNLLHLQHQHQQPSLSYHHQQQQQQFNRRSLQPIEQRLRYEAHDMQQLQRRRSLSSLEHQQHQQKTQMHGSDEERKTNSPDSLLVRSSESESSMSDEYGHTDDSGAFLEKNPPNNLNTVLPDVKQGHGNKLKHKFAKLFAPSNKHTNVATNNTSKPNPGEINGKSHVTNGNGLVQNGKKSNGHSPGFEYENIPRIDIAKLEQRNSWKSASSSSGGSSSNRDNCSPTSSKPHQQPTIEQLRMEEGCQLRNQRNLQQQRPMFPGGNPSNAALIREYQQHQQLFRQKSGDQNGRNSSNGSDKMQEDESNGTEADGSKLSVREILKRFEELRSHNESQQQQANGGSGEDKSSPDRTLNTIQETLQKLDEKVKSYQVEQKPGHKSNNQQQSHHENHVSQLGKSIVSQQQQATSNGHLHSSQQQQQQQHGGYGNGHDSSMLNGVRSSNGHMVNGGSNGMHYQKNGKSPQNQHNQEWRQHDEQLMGNGPLRGEDGLYDGSSPPPQLNNGTHSLLQYAMLNFRQTSDKFEMLKTADGSISGSLKVIESLKGKKKGKKGKQSQDGAEWTWKEQVDLVKYSAQPIEQSLLRLDNELSAIAVECFLCLMRYMGDQPLPADMSEVKCVYTILMHCHKFEQLRDEVYCQLMKQTTNNKSPNPESCQRGWRLFSIVAAYFTCSESLKPYLAKYLETAAYDKRRAYHGTATVCLQNLRKTVKYGGRKNVPSVEEIMAISAGRNAKRQIYRLPGGTERVINTKCTTVVQDVIEEMCNIISVRNPHEMDEFSLYCIVDGDAFTMPLARDEYVLDVTTELHKNHQLFYLIFCRSVWYYPLRLDAPLYVEVVFNQIAPDYLEGLLLVLPGEHLPQEIIYDMAQIAALLHRAADVKNEREEPTTKRIKYLLPKPALSLREPRPQQWANMVQQAWSNVQHSSIASCKAQVLEILSKWPLFGSSFFAVKRVPEGKEKGSDHILALNRHGVHFIDLITHETLYHYPYSEVISTRKVKSEEGTLYLDMKCGNLMQQRITRLQTEQAHEISRLIRQYITMEQRTSNNQTSPPPPIAWR